MLQLVNIIVGLVELILLLRFLLRLLGANPAAPFASWLYATSAPLLEPFRGLFPSPVIERGLVLEFSTLFAILIYALFGWLVSEFIFTLNNITNNRRKTRVSKTKVEEE